MSDYIWMSRPFGDTDASRSLTSDQLERDEVEALACGRRNEQGEPLGPECFPKVIWPKPDARKRDESPHAHLFGGAATWFVSGRLASSLREFDMGEARLYPVEYLQKDRQAAVKGDWFAISFGNRKEALLPEQSKSLKNTFNPKVKRLAPTIQDDDVCFAAHADHGADLWVEPGLMHALCLSGPLGDAILERGLTRGFEGRGMIRGRVLAS